MTGAAPGHLRRSIALVVELTITAAAEHLQVSTATVKRRLHNGTLKGRKVPRPQGYTWLVEVDQDSTPTTTTADATLITALRDQVQAQAEELEARRREVAELHQLLGQQTALNAGRRPWWRFW